MPFEKERLVFQALFFNGHVSFRGGACVKLLRNARIWIGFESWMIRSRQDTYQAAVNDETKRIPARMQLPWLPWEEWHFRVDRHEIPKRCWKWHWKYNLFQICLCHCIPHQKIELGHLSSAYHSLTWSTSTRQGGAQFAIKTCAPMWTSNWGFWWLCGPRGCREKPGSGGKTGDFFAKANTYIVSMLFTSATKYFSWTQFSSEHAMSVSLTPQTSSVA